MNTLIGWYRDDLDVQARLPILSTWMGHGDPKWTYWYLSASPELLVLAARTARVLRREAAMTALSPTLQAWFTDRLIGQRQVSPHTAASYRDTFRLLFAYLSDTTGKSPAELDFEDLDASAVGGFLAHLEHNRGISAATRNARLAAVRSMFHFASFQHPEHAATIARVLAIPTKRRDRPLVTYLTGVEIDALLAAPERLAGRSGRRGAAGRDLALPSTSTVAPRLLPRGRSHANPLCSCLFTTFQRGELGASGREGRSGANRLGLGCVSLLESLPMSPS